MYSRLCGYDARTRQGHQVRGHNMIMHGQVTEITSNKAGPELIIYFIKLAIHFFIILPG